MNTAARSAGAAAVKARARKLYNRVNRQLNLSARAERDDFLTWGYVADGAPEYAAFALDDQ
jgi:hypothetical protein